MPRVLKRTPEWLMQPSPGYHFFADSPKAPKLDANKSQSAYTGPLRKIVKGRGTEVFVASGNELRWADLRILKDEYEALEGQDQTRQIKSYKLLKVSGHGEITQLVVSPDKDFIAVVRSHTVHIVALPRSEDLYKEDQPLKPKCFQLGPTAHVLEEAPIVSVLWHPLGSMGKCLVTITKESVLRLWEINQDNRSSFDEPSTSFDLKKLANATSAELDLRDIRASAYGTNKGFTPDSVELEPAAACFGGKGEAGEFPWRSMTLWIAMAGGDVYALCPLLPKRFQAFPGFLNSVSMTLSAKNMDDEQTSANTAVTDKQAEWLDELEDQEPFIPSNSTGIESAHVYSRPEHPGPAPKLQGPFAMVPELDDDPDLADILVVGLDAAENADADEPQLTAASVICLLTTSGNVTICLDLDGIEAQWLPTGTTPFSTPAKKQLVPLDDVKTLLPFETLQISRDKSSKAYPTLVPDVCSPYSFFAADGCGIHYISMTSWIRDLQTSFSDQVEDGAAFRIGSLVDSAKSLVEHPISFSRDTPDVGSSCLVLADLHTGESGLGYLAIASIAGQPWAAQFDIEDGELAQIADQASHDSGEQEEAAPKELLLTNAREPYRADPAFWKASKLPLYIRNLPAHYARSLKGEVRLSEDNLKMLTHEIHPLIAAETRDLNKAAAELFRQCERLRDDLREQIERVREIKDKIESLTGQYDEEAEIDAYDGHCGTDRLEYRVDLAAKRQKSIVERCEALKKKLAKAAARELSDKERIWMKEVEKLNQSIPEQEGKEERDLSPLLRRLAEVKSLTKELKEQAEEAKTRSSSNGGLARSGVKVPEQFRKQRVQGVMDLLDRESALVEAAVEKLNRLKVDS